MRKDSILILIYILLPMTSLLPSPLFPSALFSILSFHSPPQGDLHYTVPSTVFGLLSVAAGLLSLLLPETGNTNLPETVADVEALPR